MLMLKLYGWYSLSYWTISKESIHQIQRLVHNYIWYGKEDHATQAKVAWPILTAPKSRGGLGLIDPLVGSGQGRLCGRDHTMFCCEGRTCVWEI